MRVMSEAPLVVKYRGNLCDTAILVGLKNLKIEIDQIVFDGELDFVTRRYVVILNEWLAKNRMPTISKNKNDVSGPYRNLLKSPLSAWNWGDEECAAAIRLAGLPLPPPFFDSKLGA